jgi:hypothetical protein
MADLTQSSATTTTTTPQYYTNYITNLANKGTQYGVGGANAPLFADATQLQQNAFNNVAQNAGIYQPNLNTSSNLMNKAAGTDIMGAANPYLQAGSSSSADLVNNYMNPYTQNVVDKIRLANQQNIQQNLSPGITGGAVGSGQFGSQRGANALALGISNADIGALAQQAAAMQSGYSDALKAAQAQRAAQLSAGQMAGNAATQQAANYRDVATQRMNLAQQQQAQSLADINAQATLGAQQQQIEQNKQLFPLDVLAKQAAVLSGATIPTSTEQQMTGSPLSAIAGLGALATGVAKVPAVSNWLSGLTVPGAGTGRDAYGNLLPGWTTDASGKPIVSNPSGEVTDFTGGGPNGKIADSYTNSVTPVDSSNSWTIGGSDYTPSFRTIGGARGEDTPVDYSGLVSGDSGP